jgi:hypothetical protein
MGLGYDGLGTHNLNGIPQIEVLQHSNDGKYTMRVTPPGEPSAGPIVDRLRQVFDVKTDVALAEKLNLGTSAPSNWRQRNAPPYPVCVLVAATHGISLDWLVFGVGVMRPGAGDDASTSTAMHRSAQADRLVRFVEFWDASRPNEEMVWLEYQVKRAVPEYGDWLPSTMGGNG